MVSVFTSVQCLEVAFLLTLFRVFVYSYLHTKRLSQIRW